MPEKRIFVAHRFDLKSPTEVRKKHSQYARLFGNSGFQIVSMANEYGVPELNVSDEQIVQRSLDTISNCTHFILDMSESKWKYIGSLFELAFARSIKLPTYCYTESVKDLSRPWLRYHCDFITTSQSDLVSVVIASKD